MNRKYTKNEIENQNVNNMFADLEKLPVREKLERDGHKRFKIFFWVVLIPSAIFYINCLLICKDHSIAVGGILFGVTITIILINAYRKTFTEYNNTLKIIRNKKVNIQLDLFKSANYLYLSGQLENTEKFEKYFYNRGKYKKISQKNLTNAYANLLFTLLNNNKIQMKKLKEENIKLLIKLFFFFCIAFLLLIGLLNFSKSNSDLFKGILTCLGSLLTMIIGNSLDTWYHRFSEGNDIESINSEISKKIVEELKYEYTNNQLNTENERSFENLLFDKKNQQSKKKLKDLIIFIKSFFKRIWNRKK